MDRDQMITHLSLLGWVPARGHVPHLWYGLYNPVSLALVQDYVSPRYGIDVADGFTKAEMMKGENCYAAWNDIPTDWLERFREYLEEHPTVE